MMGHISKIFRGKLRVYIIFILSIIVLISVGRAFQQAQDISFDLSFSPTKLVSEGINHYEYILDGNEPAYVDMPIWFTHNITNIGDTELITLFWINEPYNPDDSDTYFNKV